MLCALYEQLEMDLWCLHIIGIIYLFLILFLGAKLKLKRQKFIWGSQMSWITFNLIEDFDTFNVCVDGKCGGITCIHTYTNSLSFNLTISQLYFPKLMTMMTMIMMMAVKKGVLLFEIDMWKCWKLALI